MGKEITLTIPTDWAGISLKKYLNLQRDLANYSDSEEAMTALMFSHLCGLDAEYVQSLNVEDFNNIKGILEGFINTTDLPLQKIIKIGDIEYGFEPNLSQISYGAYADISKFGELTINDNWAKIMSILYRPIAHRKGDTYSIKPYEGIGDEKIWIEVSMDN